MNLDQEYEDAFNELQRVGEGIKRLAGIVQNFGFVPDDQQLKDWLLLQKEWKDDLNEALTRTYRAVLTAKRESNK